MTESKKMGFIDYMVLLVKWKKIFITISLTTAIVSYLIIYLFIDKEYTGTACIIPAESSDISSVLGAVKGLKGLPLNLGSNFTNDEMSIYNTIISSRSLLDDVIEKFDLIEVYDLDTTDIEYKEKALKILSNNITTKETKDGAYEISVTANTPQNAADMTNYIVELLNKRIVDLKIKKSSDDREFLEKRVSDIRNQLKLSEDSLRIYQEASGILSAKDQLKGIIDAYAGLESQLIVKQIEKSVLERIVQNNSPQLSEMKIQIQEFERKLGDLKKNGEPNSVFLPLQSLPKKAIAYLRYYREVEINSTLLEFVLPLYENAKFDEQKDVPILQVVDTAVPPAKKSFPPRTVFTLLITFGVFIITFFVVLIKENQNFKNSSKLIYIKNNLFKWKTVE